jgi:hypothetical protein
MYFYKYILLEYSVSCATPVALLFSSVIRKQRERSRLFIHPAIPLHCWDARFRMVIPNLGDPKQCMYSTGRFWLWQRPPAHGSGGCPWAAIYALNDSLGSGSRPSPRRPRLLGTHRGLSQASSCCIGRAIDVSGP